MNKKHILFNLALATCYLLSLYFVYWQGYYRGADNTLCVMEIAIDKAPGNRCELSKHFFHWFDDK